MNEGDPHGCPSLRTSVQHTDSPPMHELALKMAAVWNLTSLEGLAPSLQSYGGTSGSCWGDEEKVYQALPIKIIFSQMAKQ